MKARFICLIIATVFLWPVICPADSKPELEITQDALNKLVGRLGVLSDAGVSVPFMFSVPEHWSPIGYLDRSLSGEVVEKHGIPLMIGERVDGGVQILPWGPWGSPVPWQWWIINPHFTLNDGWMEFTATVRSRIAGIENVVTRTVGAEVRFEPPPNHLFIAIDDFEVRLETEINGHMRYVGKVDVAELYMLSVRLDPQDITVPLLDGTTKTGTGEVVEIEAVYEAGAVKLEADVRFFF